MMRGSAPAKAILFGEHAVVYGYPAIAFPVRQLTCEVRAEPRSDGRTLIHAPQTSEILDVQTDQDHPLVVLWQLLQETQKVTLPAADFTVHSKIPIAAGFGSGAALSTALIDACMKLLGTAIPLHQQNEMVYQIEKRYHGTPSGIDNHVVVYQKPLFFQPGAKLEFLHWPQTFPILSLQCGKGAPTHQVLTHLRKRRRLQPQRFEQWFAAIGETTQAAKMALVTGDLVEVGKRMYENHALLQQLGVSSPLQDEAVECARSLGALGAKMSGAGWGGQVLVLADADSFEELTRSLEQQGWPIVFRDLG
ncbi:MAG: mevalonate kinase [Chloroflexi bacterium]|nr:mevalonate kinase [Chloroflexota bacterium]